MKVKKWIKFDGFYFNRKTGETMEEKPEKNKQVTVKNYLDGNLYLMIKNLSFLMRI